jgi:plastocyanin
MESTRLPRALFPSGATRRRRDPLLSGYRVVAVLGVFTLVQIPAEVRNSPAEHSVMGMSESGEKAMRNSVKTWPIWLLLLAATSAWAVPHTVTVGGTVYVGGYYSPSLTFNPPALTINAGDTVTFTNSGGMHNVDANDGSFRCANGCDGDGHGGNGTPSSSAWSSTVTFNQAGVFAFHCDVHGAMMSGAITVRGATPGNVPITAGFTGAWYNHDQSGHGILLEILPDNRALAYWFAYNPDGTQQAWFGGDGSVANDTITISADMGAGGRWVPNFDPSQFVLNHWGTFTFTFTDCNHGRVDFVSVLPDYGTNHMDLDRLTQPAGLTCP